MWWLLWRRTSRRRSWKRFVPISLMSSYKKVWTQSLLGEWTQCSVILDLTLTGEGQKLNSNSQRANKANTLIQLPLCATVGYFSETLGSYVLLETPYDAGLSLNKWFFSICLLGSETYNWSVIEKTYQAINQVVLVFNFTVAQWHCCLTARRSWV